jgi:hypothetical protein
MCSFQQLPNPSSLAQKIDIQLATPVIDFSGVNTRWRTALGVASVLEALRRWHITCTFLISGLTTTAIVAGLSSTIAQKQNDYAYYLADSEDYSCIITTNPGTPPVTYGWHLPNGSWLSTYPDLDFCPGSISMTLLGAANTVDPQNYGYADEGVAVHESALGAPARSMHHRAAIAKSSILCSASTAKVCYQHLNAYPS